MEPETPAAPPEARLIRTAREAAGMTAAQAAQATGGAVSATYWRDVERGYGGRRGQRAAAKASARLLAAMARVTGVTPEELAGARREDAARVLAEIQRREGAPPADAPPPPKLAIAPNLPPSGRLAEWLTSLPDADIERVVAHDPLLRQVWDLQDGTGKPADRAQRIAMLVVVLTPTDPMAMVAERREGNAGLDPEPPQVKESSKDLTTLCRTG